MDQYTEVVKFSFAAFWLVLLLVVLWPLVVFLELQWLLGVESTCTLVVCFLPVSPSYFGCTLHPQFSVVPWPYSNLRYWIVLFTWIKILKCMLIIFWESKSNSFHATCVSQLYFGLLVFVGYIVVDTQDIIEKAHLGDLDYVNHSLTLFTDFVGVFVRVLIIMVSVENYESCLSNLSLLYFSLAYCELRWFVAVEECIWERRKEEEEEGLSYPEIGEKMNRVLLGNNTCL